MSFKGTICDLIVNKKLAPLPKKRKTRGWVLLTPPGFLERGIKEAVRQGGKNIPDERGRAAAAIITYNNVLASLPVCLSQSS